MKIKLNFKRDFVTGIITILPLWLTLFIIWVLFKWVSNIAMPVLKPVSLHYFGKDWGILVNIVSFFLTIFTIWLIGVIVTQIISRRFIFLLDQLIVKIPVLSGIYSSLRKLTNFIFRTEKQNFKSVGIVEFPRRDSYAIGFVTGKSGFGRKGNLAKVFIPSTPNPATGFLIFVKEKDILPLEISVDDAIKAIISGGIIMPNELFGKKKKI